MAKIILNNESVGVEGSEGFGKPYKLPINDFIWESVGKNCVDLSSEVKTIFLSDKQKLRLQNSRAKNFFIDTWLPKQVILDILDNADCVYAWALSPCHDCDKFPDGSLKKPHFHLILQFTTNYSFSKVAYMFHTTEFRRLGETWYYEYHYLYHGTEKAIREGKYLYNEEDIIASDLSYIKSKAIPIGVSFSYSDIIFDILNGMSQLDLVRKYEGVYVRNKRNLYDIVSLHKAETQSITYHTILNVYELGDNVYKVEFSNGHIDIFTGEQLKNYLNR